MADNKADALSAFDDSITKFVPNKHRMDAMPTIGALTQEIRAQMNVVRDAMSKIDGLLAKHDELATKSASGMLDIAAMWGK